MGGAPMADDDYVFDEATGEWRAPGEVALAEPDPGAVEVRDAVGSLLADCDQVTLSRT